MSSKRNKKRTKKYAGEDAKHLQAPVESAPVVHRYAAVQRSRPGQWWYEKKKTVRIVAIIAGVISLVTWLGVELFAIIF